MTRALFIILLVAVSLLGSSAVAAMPANGLLERATPSVKTHDFRYVQRQISPQEARAIALSRVPGGEVVDIRKTGDVYRVRIIARDGRVIDIVVDANTGRVR